MRSNKRAITRARASFARSRARRRSGIVQRGAI
jgi:hypothetical protein